MHVSCKTKGWPDCWSEIEWILHVYSAVVKHIMFNWPIEIWGALPLLSSIQMVQCHVVSYLRLLHPDYSALDLLWFFPTLTMSTNVDREDAMLKDGLDASSVMLCNGRWIEELYDWHLHGMNGFIFKETVWQAHDNWVLLWYANVCKRLYLYGNEEVEDRN